MIENKQSIMVGVGALIAFVLQVIVAPNIMIMSIMPNFMLAYVVVIAIVCARSCGYIMPFVMGLLFDLIGGGPVGSSALLYLVATFLLSHVFLVLDNGSFFMPCVMSVITIVAVEILHGVFVMWTGTPVSFLDALLYRSLPCAIYGCLAVLLMYPLVVRFISGRDNSVSSLPQIGM